MVVRILSRVICSNFVNYGSKIIGMLAPLLVPPLHILFLYYFWREFARDVDKQYCSCSCWDTVFKGSYESGIASYKHMYFNATSNTIKIWVIVVIGVVTFYETTKYLARLAFHCRLRYGMLVLFITSTFSHYYSWWVYINYLNDDFYSQWYHQLFFTVTELISTIFVIILADNKYPVAHRKAFIIAGIALMHIFAGSWDQFVANVVRGEGYAHQVIRDLGFMIPDILHVMIPLCLVTWRDPNVLPDSNSKSLLSKKNNKHLSLSIKRDLTYMLGLIVVGLCMCSIL
ncbi:uncharacterized protein LOC141537432 [Cotesia typhae]|uniref:uncharacterized protein LOC141537432 n=1 Tax=Cotesia typhae TaxID=2053667 RepID=UPI003D69C308